MVAKVILFLLGAGLAGGGGYLGWLHQADIASVSFTSFDPATAPWMLFGAAGAVLVGLILMLTGLLLPNENKAKRAEEAARRAEAIRQADAFYSERARAADRDWRSGDLPADAPAAAQDAVREPAPLLPPLKTDPVEPPPANPFTAPVATAPIPAAPRPAPPLPPVERAPQPVATAAGSFGAPASAAGQTAAAAPAMAAPAAAAGAGAGAPFFPEIRKALADSRLEDADRLLQQERSRLQSSGDKESLELAELTALAGDHAAAAGRLGGAKWLWRLALNRFSTVNALSSPAARAVSERLRLADQ